MPESKYFCRNCDTQIKSTDTICPKCGRNLSEVGRAIKVELVETISLSDNAGLSNRISGSMTSISGDIVTTSSFINAIPKEKREEIGISDKLMGEIETVKNMVQTLTENTAKSSSVKIEGFVTTAPVNFFLQGNNIVEITNIDESFNGIYQEIDKMNIDSKIKKQAKSKAQELKEEAQKEKPDIDKIRKIWSELKTLAPFLVSSVQLLSIVSKLLLH
jgi:hypothetical protein